MSNPNIWTPNAMAVGAIANPDFANQNIEYLKYAIDNMITDTDVLKDQSVNSFNDSPYTQSIFDISADNLTGNKIKAGIKFNTVIDGYKHRYYLAEDIDIGALDPDKLYYICLKVKDGSKYKRILGAADLDVILLNKEMLWKPTESTISTRINDEIMTSNSQNGYVITVSSSAPGYHGYLAMNGNTVDGWFSLAGTNSGTWALELPEPRLCNHYSIYPYTGDLSTQPKNWTFEGSNNGTDWVVLHTVTNYTTWATNWNNFYFDSSVSYQHYRINATASVGSNVVGSKEIRMFHDKAAKNITSGLYLGGSDSTITDKYLNSIITIGNPVLAAGILACDGTGDGVKSSSITSLGSGKWITHLPGLKFNSTSVLITLLASYNQYSIKLQRTTANKLALYLSSSGASYNIANGALGSKADWSTSTTYSIRVRFTGEQYIVEWSTDGIIWTPDITISSSIPLASTGGLIIGMDHLHANAFNGDLTIDGIQLVVGNDYLQSNGDFCYDGQNVYIGYPQDFTPDNSVSAIMLGELVTGASAVSSAITYAFNRQYARYISTTSGVTATVIHNLGISENKTTLYEGNIQKSKDITAGSKSNSFISTLTGYTKVFIQEA